jgi:hypothetical protein
MMCLLLAFVVMALACIHKILVLKQHRDVHTTYLRERIVCSSEVLEALSYCWCKEAVCNCHRPIN